ncbi:hypothetical protein HFX_2461 [Haloferax mediterranei ATCC 33500]|uniref:Uncharacterized protein n=1 Tax=Haloferax mediterranei (strain ATCC 33500 / DSM 1411 / JCM 8866 / NBRC 14739 / NCIMB 2177 / R-4) TaxID=523841 RepID=I3R7D7_HALMT|nr:hypothetical protein HFX_2461 [Haloferax mediterranei ATCC 33500]
MFREVLDEVVGERVEVVDDDEARHRGTSVGLYSMRRIASSTPPIFCSVSSYSEAGSESATRPAPARTVIMSSFPSDSTVAVRMTMAMSASPVHE